MHYVRTSLTGGEQSDVPSTLRTDLMFTGDDLKSQHAKFKGNIPLDVSYVSNKEPWKEVLPILHNYFANSSSKNMHCPQSHNLCLAGMAPIKGMKYIIWFSLALSRPKRGNVSKSTEYKSPGTFKHYPSRLSCFHKE